MAKAKPSPRQQEILDLMKGQPGITPGEIADVLDTTPGAIYQQLSRLRNLKLLPKATASQRGKLLAPATPTRVTGPSASETASNGHISLEDHLNQELTGVTERIEEIVTERAEIEAERQQRLDALASEEGGLTERQKRLDAAQKALVPA